MGLTIHWRLKSGAEAVGEARTLVERLRRRACDLPFAGVGEIVELEGRDADFNLQPMDSSERWLLVQAGQYINSGGFHYSVAPLQVIAFETEPGDGCEPANFGLCRYPAFIEVCDQLPRNDRRPRTISGTRRLETGLAGWSWASFCKTQYASDPNCGGVENFLRCHLTVIALLDHARSLGLIEQVVDEGNYWESRDVKALAQEVGSWNEMIAGFAGRLRDELGANVESPITSFPNFEHLEARGRRDSPLN